MEVRRIIMIALGGGLIIATGLLYVRVSRSESSQVDPAALAKAESEYKAQASRRATKPRPERSSIEAPTRSRPAPRVERPESPPETSRPPPRPLTLPSTHPTSASSDNGADQQSYADRRKAVNRLYDRGRYPQARKAALELLEEREDDRKMLRVVVSSSCIMYEPDVAREYFQKLAERDKKTMRIRCARYEVDGLD